MPLYLIDDRGEIWPSASRELRAAQGAPFAGSEFVDYAVLNLGFVAVGARGGSCQVKMRPAFVGPATWRALQAWLAAAEADRVGLCWYDCDWDFALLRAGEAIAARLEAMGPARPPEQAESFIARGLDARGLAPGEPLRRLVEDWPVLAAEPGQGTLLDLVDTLLGQRYLVVKHDGETCRLHFHAFGAGLFADYDVWRSCAVGAPMEEMPDRGYGQLVAPGYYRALAEARPLVEDVDALIEWPREGRRRLRYKRVIVPLRSGDGASLLVGGSILDDSIDLRRRRL